MKQNLQLQFLVMKDKLRIQTMKNQKFKMFHKKDKFCNLMNKQNYKLFKIKIRIIM